MRHDYQFSKAVGQNGLTVFVCETLFKRTVSDSIRRWCCPVMGSVPGACQCCCTPSSLAQRWSVLIPKHHILFALLGDFSISRQCS